MEGSLSADRKNNPSVFGVHWSAPLRWLAAGWRDLNRTPGIGIPYGITFVVIAHALVTGLRMAGLPHLWLPAMIGMTFLGPVLAVGLYEASRLLEMRLKPNLQDSAAAWQANPHQILGLGMVLVFLWLMWLMVEFGLFAVLFMPTPPRPDSFVADLLAHEATGRFMIGSLIVTLPTLALAFALTAVTGPFLLHQQSDLVRAMMVSIAAVARNPGPMLLWSLCILLLIGIGLATQAIGLLVIGPLLGHATWHAYRDLVRPLV